jgi:hypothetical protein
MAAPSAATDASATVGQKTYPVCRTRKQDSCRVARSPHGR